MYNVIDNFLTPSEAHRIESFLFSLNFPWFYGDRVVSDSDISNIECSEIDNYQLSHLFYRNYTFTGQFHNILDPIIKKLEAESLVKIKANLNPRTETIVKHGYHRDLPIDCLTAVYYVNTNNGYTEFKTGDRIESISGRLLVFNSSEYHTGSTCTDKSARSVINLNFFSSKLEKELVK
jgi:hypothetical protein